MRKTLLALVVLVVGLIPAPASADHGINVAEGATVTLVGDFFTGGWGGGLVVSPQRVTDGAYLPSGTQWDQGGVWWDETDGDTRYIVIDLGARCLINTLNIQADDNDAYTVLGRAPSGGWATLWEVPNYDALGWGLLTRPDTTDNEVRHKLDKNFMTNRIAIKAGATGDDLFSVSEFQAFGHCF